MELTTQALPLVLPQSIFNLCMTGTVLLRIMTLPNTTVFFYTFLLGVSPWLNKVIPPLVPVRQQVVMTLEGLLLITVILTDKPSPNPVKQELTTFAEITRLTIKQQPEPKYWKVYRGNVLSHPATSFPFPMVPLGRPNGHNSSSHSKVFSRQAEGKDTTTT